MSNPERVGAQTAAQCVTGTFKRACSWCDAPATVAVSNVRSHHVDVSCAVCVAVFHPNDEIAAASLRIMSQAREIERESRAWLENNRAMRHDVMFAVQSMFGYYN